MSTTAIKVWFLGFLLLPPVCGVIGALFLKPVVDKIRVHNTSESWHQLTVHAALGKTDKAFTDRYVSRPAPIFRMSNR